MQFQTTERQTSRRVFDEYSQELCGPGGRLEGRSCFLRFGVGTSFLAFSREQDCL